MSGPGGGGTFGSWEGVISGGVGLSGSDCNMAIFPFGWGAALKNHVGGGCALSGEIGTTFCLESADSSGLMCLGYGSWAG
jgi:hypothetical protein